MLVFPLVPVTPKERRRPDGHPWNQAVSGPLTARGSSTTRVGSEDAGRSLIATTAPAAAAWCSNSRPW